MEKQCRRTDVLGRLDEREERCGEKRLLKTIGAEDLVGKGSEGDDEKRRKDASDDLDQQRLTEEATQAAPVLARDVPEAVLRERLLDSEVEKHLEEPDDDECRHEYAEVVEPEDARRDDRPRDAARDGGVDPRSRRRPAPENPGGHRGVSVGRPSLGPIPRRPSL